MNSLKKSRKTNNKQEMNKTVEDQKMKINAIKQAQTEGIQKIENLGMEIGIIYRLHQQNARHGRENLRYRR